MVPELSKLAENTLIRDILFSDEPSPLLYQCSLSTDKCNFENEFIYRDKVLNININGNQYLPSPICHRVISILCEFCPKFTPEWAFLLLMNSEISELSLSNLTVSNKTLVQRSSLLYKIFARCQNIKQLHFEMMDMESTTASGIFTQCLLPRAEQYTSISLSTCLTVQNNNVTMLLRNCSNLEKLNLSCCKISDEAFCNVHLPKVQCCDCGNRRHRPLKLSVLNIAGCVKLTTKTIRRVVELCGPSLRCLYMNQCTNIYTTALWYLCGLFKGKEEIFSGDFSLKTPLSCCCDIDLSLRNIHKQCMNKGANEIDSTKDNLHEYKPTSSTDGALQFLQSIQLSSLTAEEFTVSDDFPSPSITPENVNESSWSISPNQIPNLDRFPDNNGEASASCSRDCTSEIANSDDHTVMPHVEEQPLLYVEEASDSHNLPLTVSYSETAQECSGPSDYNQIPGSLPDKNLGESASCSKDYTPSLSENPEAQQSSVHNLEETIQRTMYLLDEQCEFLGAFLRHTTDEGVVTEQASSSNSDADVVVGNSDGVTQTSHSFEEYSESLLMHLDLINSDTQASRLHLIKVIEQSYDDVNVTEHISFQIITKSIMVSAQQIMSILDQYVNSVFKEREENPDVLGESSMASVFFETIPQFRDKLITYVSILGQVRKEIKQNELLRLRLLNSLELEAIQREELAKIRNLNDQLTTLHAQHEAVFGRMNQLFNGANLQQNEEVVNHDIAVEDVEHGNIADPADSDSSDSEITDDEVYDENSPELVNLLKSEAKLLLQHAKYSHCPSCCPNAYTPKLEQLDITDISFQSEEIAVMTLKGFLTVNQGLKLLNLSWSCVDNSLMEFVAAKCPDLKCLNVQQCTQLSTPFLEYFSQHNLVSLDTLGVSWLHDSDILSLLSQNTSNLTKLNLAESNISDISLFHLAKFSQLRYLNLSWCDEVTDEGLSAVISGHTSTLETVMIRQCGIGVNTLKAISQCSNLIQLDISTNVEISDEVWVPLALGLPLLEELDCSWVFGMTDTRLALLFQHCHELRKLTIDGHKQITTNLFRKIIVSLPNGKRIRSAQYAPRLMFVSLQYCNDIEDDELWEIVQLCRGSLIVRNYYGDELEYVVPDNT